MISARLADRLIGLASMAILARLLEPDDFGLLALAAAIVAIIETLGAFSFDWVLVREERLDRSKLDTAWTLRLIVDVALALGVIVAGHWAAGFYQDPRLGPVATVLAFALLVSALENIGTVYFRREMRFDREFILRFTGKLCGFLVTIPLAFAWQNYWALIAGIVASKVAVSAVSYVMHPYRPRLSVARSRELLGFSIWLQINSMLDLLRTRLPDFVIGRVSGVQAVGLYSVANEIANLPSTELVAPINRAVFPGYAKQVVDRGPLAQTFLNVVGMIWVIALPAALGVAATAPYVVATLLGTKWLDAIPILRILAVAGATYVLYTNVSYVFLAVGRPRLSTALSALTVLLFVPGLFVLAPSMGPIGSAYAYAATALVMLPVSYFLAARMLDLGFGRLAAVTWRPLLAAVSMYLVVVNIGDPDLTSGAAALLPGMMACIGIGVATYIVLLWCLWIVSGRPDGAERSITDLLVERWQRLIRPK